MSNLRLIQSKQYADRTVKVYYNHHLNEYTSQLYLRGYHQVDADYFTDSKVDALGTADAMLRPDLDQ